MYKEVTYTEAKEKFSYILRDAQLSGQGYVVTKRGVPVAKIEKIYQKPVATKKLVPQKAQKKIAIDDLFGLWKDDPRTTEEIVRDLRIKAYSGSY